MMMMMMMLWCVSKLPEQTLPMRYKISAQKCPLIIISQYSILNLRFFITVSCYQYDFIYRWITIFQCELFSLRIVISEWIVYDFMS